MHGIEEGLLDKVDSKPVTYSTLNISSGFAAMLKRNGMDFYTLTKGILMNIE